MKEKELTVGLLNGFYQMVTSKNYDLITENIMKCPKKIADPMARAILSYEHLSEDRAYEILLKTFDIYKKYFCKVKSNEEMYSVIQEAEKIKSEFKNAEEKMYAARILVTFVDEVELSYKESVNGSNA
ncbi:hypothetical protein [Eubacterium sp.]|uniref:hypothetical protein n=1 Tax=Eubacterium sp. TaxID=142586 RepID=UPI003522EF47